MTTLEDFAGAGQPYDLSTLLRAQFHGLENRGEQSRAHFTVFDPEDGPVSVRWWIGRSVPWRCGVDGDLELASCDHTFSAALIMAGRYLGLTVASIMDPEAVQDEFEDEEQFTPELLEFAEQRTRLVRVFANEVAAEMGFISPLVARRLIDLANITLDVNGDPDRLTIRKRLAELAESEPWMLKGSGR